VKLALFDLDGTLSRKDTEREWAYLLGERGWLDPSGFDRFQESYRRGDLVLQHYYDWYKDIYARIDRPTLDALRDELVAERMLPSIPGHARAWIAEERAAGAACLLVTASNHYLTEPIGRGLGLDGTLATHIEERDGHFTGELLHTPCFREHKVTRVEQWLAERDTRLADLAHSVFYSDSHNDLPLLEAVRRAVVVDPDPQLERIARDRGWERRALVV
jgi:HAD superfamily hydrolase (TIGR01490 family)